MEPFSASEYNTSPAVYHESERKHFTTQHLRALSIEVALRDCAGLPIREFALIVSNEDGDEKTFTSQSLKPHQSQIFTKQFRQEFRSNSLQVARSNNQTNAKRRRLDRSKDFTQSLGHVKSHIKQSQDIQNTRQIRIGDNAKVKEFYLQRFKDLQQGLCKVIAKVFIKVLEPKKQTNYPYTKGDGRAPPWWPMDPGNLYIRHREPDHLLRPERLALLVYILRIVIEIPSKKSTSFKNQDFDVQRLEEATMKEISSWLRDEQHPGNAAKEPYIKEIFRVAKTEERYTHNKIDGDTLITLSCWNQAMSVLGNSHENSRDDVNTDLVNTFHGQWSVQDQDRQSRSRPATNTFPPRDHGPSPYIQPQFYKNSLPSTGAYQDRSAGIEFESRDQSIGQSLPSLYAFHGGQGSLQNLPSFQQSTYRYPSFQTLGAQQSLYTDVQGESWTWE